METRPGVSAADRDQLKVRHWLLGITAAGLVLLYAQAWYYWPPAADALQTLEGRLELTEPESRPGRIHTLRVVGEQATVEFECRPQPRYKQLLMGRQPFDCSEAAWIRFAVGHRVRVGYDLVSVPFEQRPRLLELSVEGRPFITTEFTRGQFRQSLLGKTVFTLGLCGLLLVVFELIFLKERQRRARLLQGKP